ncbi:DUF4306 domain-containing protein [Aneurinibacillus sp. REN35]|uniref:DUF4306 domain-containing protein n=1 Tax=Aneurinibacillus sp. REN35 TaxID=3237286 RepID=UPI0035273540
MRGAIYGIQMILAGFGLMITYSIARWQASEFWERSAWQQQALWERGSMEGASQLDELLYVSKHHPSTITVLLLCLFYMVFLMMLYIRRRQKT